MVKKSLLTFLFLFLFLFSFCVIAVKPTPTVQESINGLTIISLKNDNFKFNSSFDLYFHVFNSSNALMTFKNATCIIHVYNSSNNNHVVIQNLSVEGDDYELSSTYLYSVANEVGIHPYIVYCTSISGELKEYGFVSDSIVINMGGNNEEVGFFNGFLILLPLLIGLILVIAGFSLGDEHQILKIFMLLSSLVTFFMSMGLALVTISHYTSFVELVDTLGLYVYFYGIIYFLIVIYYLIYIIWKVIDWIGTQKSERLNY